MFKVTFALPALLCVLASPSFAEDLVEIQIRNSADTHDDYVTWAPTKARIRLIQASGRDLAVMLANDDGSNRGGDLVFDGSVGIGETATQDTLTLNLPGDGSWVPFVVAGRFGHPSLRDKDAVIEVRRQDDDGELAGRHALMVRVRKDANRLTDFERKELLRALADLHFTRDEYIHFVMIHNATAYGKFREAGWDYPDQAHGAAGFLAWHRLFLLDFERKLQERFPHVTLPYWVQDQASSVFAEDFLGANGDDGTNGFAVLASSNPLFGWKMPPEAWWNPPQFAGSGPLTEAILRSNVDRQSVRYLFQFTPEQDLSRNLDYKNFAEKLERNPHNNGHNTTGPWMQNCRISPRDPIFWVFHSQQDHLWARWQWSFGRFGNTGADPDDYFPVGTYRQGNKDKTPRGHFLMDTVWPWNAEEGGPADDREARQPPVRLERFATSKVSGLWPDAPTVPHPADTIDYLGLDGRLPMGFAYDNVPFGSQSDAAPMLMASMEAPAARAASPAAGGAQASRESPAKTFFDITKPTAVRLAAAGRVHLVKESPAAPYLALIANREEPDELRAAALRLLANAGQTEFIDAALKLITDAEPGNEDLDAEAARLLAIENMAFGLEPRMRASIRQALTGLLEDRRSDVRQVAMANLAPIGNPEALRVLVGDLKRDRPLFARRDAVGWLAAAGAIENADTLRPFLDDSDPGVRATAIRALGHDPSSYPKILALITDGSQPEAVRSAAVYALMDQGRDDLAEALFRMLASPDTSERLQGEAVAGLGVWARSRVPGMDDAQKLALLRRLLDLPEALLEAHGVIMMRTLKQIHELSKQRAGAR